MENILLFLFVATLIFSIFFTVFLGHLFLINPEFFMESVFPKEKPNKKQFFSKANSAGEALVIYYGARVFVVCIAYLVVLWLFKSF